MSRKRSASSENPAAAKKRKISCPVCSQSFAHDEIEQHAWQCQPVESDNVSAENDVPQTVICPICSKTFLQNNIEAHAATCFGEERDLNQSFDTPVKRKKSSIDDGPKLVKKPSINEKPKVEKQPNGDKKQDVDKQTSSSSGEADAGLYAFGKDCMICFDEKCEISMKLDCGCSICIGCFKYYAELSIKNTQLFKCGKCGVQVSSTVFAAAGISKEQIKKYGEVEQVHLKQDTNLFRCLTRDCPEAVHMDADAFKDVVLPIQFFNQKSEDEMRKIPGVDNGIARKLIRGVPYKSWEQLEKKHKNIPKWVIANLMNDTDVSAVSPKWTCGTCKKEWCVRCKVKWHKNLSCKEAQMHDKWQEHADEHFLKLIQKGELFRCKCGMFISKSAGCKFMDCSKCGQAFCWACHSFLTISHQPHTCSTRKKKENIAKMLANRAEHGSFENMPTESRNGFARRLIRGAGRGIGRVFGFEDDYEDEEEEYDVQNPNCVIQ